MLYQLAVLLLHHPFQLVLLGEQENVSQPTGVAGSPATRNACIAAAINVCHCVELYRSHHGLKRIFVQAVYITLTAGLVLAANCKSNLSTLEEQRSSQEHVIRCIQALGEMGQTYRSAIRSIHILTTACYEASSAENPESQTN